MIAIYKNLSEIKFKRLSMLGILAADLAGFMILHGRIVSQKSLAAAVKIVMSDKSIGGNTSTLKLLEELAPLIRNFSFMLFALIFLYHCAVVFFYLRGSKGCKAYLQFYSFTAMIGTALFAGSLALQMQTNGILMVIATLCYAFFALAPKELKAFETEE